MTVYIGPSPRQLALLHLIDEARAVPPTVREMAHSLGVASTNTITCLLSALTRKGLVCRVTGQTRNVRLTSAGRDALRGR